MNQQLQDMIETIGDNDQKTFVKFLTALRADYEKTERECKPYPQHHCLEEGHWESRSITDFLKSAEDWAIRGGFGAGEDRGEPVVRTIARLLYVGRYKLREPDRDDRDWERD